VGNIIRSKKKNHLVLKKELDFAVNKKSNTKENYDRKRETWGEQLQNEKQKSETL
jgi:hypothetical protein